MKKYKLELILLATVTYIPNVYAATCPLGKDVTQDLANILKIIQIAGPIIVFAVTVFEVTKTISKGNIQDESKKLGIRLLKRVIYAILLFFVPVLIQAGAKIAQIDVSSCDLSNPTDNSYSTDQTSKKTLSTEKQTQTRRTWKGGSGSSSSGSSSSGNTQASSFNALGDRAYNGDTAAQTEWIEKVAAIVKSAQHSQYGMKNSLIIAQIMNESGWMHTPTTTNSDGSTLTNTCNNVLGINYDMGKSISSQTSTWSQNPQACSNSSVTQWDSNGNIIGTVEDMRKYNSLEDCINDYANLIYLYHPECKNNNDLDCYASFLRGYTPNPNQDIVEKYRGIIAKYNLEQYD